jgi:hypothetical protein
MSNKRSRQQAYSPLFSLENIMSLFREDNPSNMGLGYPTDKAALQQYREPTYIERLRANLAAQQEVATKLARAVEILEKNPELQELLTILRSAGI